MTYNPNIPLGTDNISSSQAQILGNFGQLNTQFAVDHVAFNTGSGNGDGTHKKITFDNAPAEPVPAGTVSNIYPLLTAGLQELFFRNATNKTQITSGGLPIWKGGPIGNNGVVTSSLNFNGFMTLPTGLIVQWGFKNISPSGGSDGGTITFPTAFTGGATPNIFAIVTTLFRNSASAADGAATVYYKEDTLTTTTFDWRYISGSNKYDGFNWIAIGK